LDAVIGETDYVSFSRTLPWDHAPGALIANEAGLRAARLDGSEYLPGDGRAGILTAHPSVWQRVSDALTT
jgi:fructose-1,6-bisphosphatase/inositol monophosphatase family enzyme